MRIVGVVVVAMVVGCGLSVDGKVSPSSQVYPPVVQALQHTLAANATFKAQVLAGIDAGVDAGFLPTGFNLTDAYTFFTSWLTTPMNESTWIQPSESFGTFINTPQGLDAVLSGPARQWLGEFIAARGAFMDSPASAALVPQWEADPAVNISEFVVPPGGFPTFNAFFIRSLAPGARPIASPSNASVIGSPVDGAVSGPQRAASDVPLTFKGEELDVVNMLGGAQSKFASQFGAGSAFVQFVLHTTSYHHFHSPVGGKVVDVQLVGGLYYGSYTAVTNSSVTPMFSENVRLVVFVDTGSPEVGLVGFVAVGIRTVSSIVANVKPGTTIEKGHDLGHFAFGGSFAAVVFTPGVSDRFVALPVSSSSPCHAMGNNGACNPVRMGQPIGEFSARRLASTVCE